MIAADDPRHGQRKGYVAGCRDDCCRIAQTRYTTQVKADHYAGRRRTVESAATIAHVNVLLETMTAGGIAAAAGLDETTVLTLPAKPRIRVATARRILSVRPATITGVEQVNATGTTRRLRALSALGYSARNLATAAGLPLWTVKDVRNGRHARVGGKVALKVVEAYTALSMTPARGATVTERRSIGTARAVAARNGWAPPLAWDDATIDDPAATPTGAGYKPGARIDQIRELEGMGLTRDGIAMRLGVKPSAIDRAIDRHARSAAA